MNHNNVLQSVLQSKELTLSISLLSAVYGKTYGTSTLLWFFPNGILVCVTQLSIAYAITITLITFFIGYHLLKLPHLFAADGARSPVPSEPSVDGAGEGGVPTPLGPDKGGDKSLHSNVIAESTQMMMTQYNCTSREFFLKNTLISMLNRL